MTAAGPGGGEVGGANGRAGTSGSFRLWLGGLLCLHLVLGLLLWEPTLFTGGDNVVYMILGRALRSGAGYVNLHLPGTPLHAKYPPLYPTLLAVADLFGSLQVSKALSLLLTTGAVGLTGLLGRRLFRPVVGLGAAAVMAVNPVLLQYSHWVLSEAPFTFLVLAALWAWERREGEVGGDGGGKGVWLPLVLAAAAFLTRTAGLPLLLVAVALPLLRRRWTEAALATAVAVAVAGGWAAYQAVAAPGATGYVEALLMVNPYDPSAGTVGLAGLIGRAATNSWLYVSTILPLSYLREPGAGRAPAGLLVAGGGLVVLVLGAIGWTRRALSRLGAPELFAIAYAGLIVLWPSVWSDQRFLLPLLPLLTVYALGGAAAAISRLVERGSGTRRSRTRSAAVVAIAVAAVGLGSYDAADRIPTRIECFAAWRQGSPCIHPAFGAFFDLARWTKDHTPPDAIVANRKPQFFWWFSRRQGDVYPFSDRPEAVLEGLDEMGADYVVFDQISTTTLRYLRPAILARQDRFELVQRTGPPETLLFRLLPEPRSASRRRGRAGRGERGRQVAHPAPGSRPRIASPSRTRRNPSSAATATSSSSRASSRMPAK